MIAVAKFSIFPVLGIAALGLLFLVFPGTYNVINNAVNKYEKGPVVSKWPARLIGIGLIILAVVTWAMHRGEF